VISIPAIAAKTAPTTAFAVPAAVSVALIAIEARFAERLPLAARTHFFRATKVAVRPAVRSLLATATFASETWLAAPLTVAATALAFNPVAIEAWLAVGLSLTAAALIFGTSEVTARLTGALEASAPVATGTFARAIVATEARLAAELAFSSPARPLAWGAAATVAAPAARMPTTLAVKLARLAATARPATHVVCVVHGGMP
jgi:hypothetical protein